MLLIRLILLTAVGLLPLLPLTAGGSAFAAETASTCCGENCQCDVLAACPCASSKENDQPSAPAIPSPERVVVQHLFDRDPQPLFELEDVDEPGILAVSTEQPFTPTSVGQRLSLLCLRLV